MEQATFSFRSYKINKFSFNDENETEDKISIKLDPKGTFILKEKKFILNFQFYAFDKDKTFKKSFVKCTLSAEFLFSNNVKSLEDIPQYFYSNSIAIVFPYLRSFISSLTIQANIKPVILPTMNLSSLSIPLKENVTIK